MAKNRRILIVDDNPRIHDDFRTILVRNDEADPYLHDLEAELFGDTDSTFESGVEFTFELDSAYQGREGLAKVREAVAAGTPYAVAFVDVRMPPGWDGIETIRHLWEVDPDLQVVICTAYSDYTWEETVDLLDPPERFLILKKPFDTVVVRQLAHSLTEKWAREQVARAEVEGLRDTVDAHTRDLERARSLLEREKTERRKVEALLRRAWEMDDASGEGGALHESFGDLEDLLTHYRSLLEDSTDARRPAVREDEELIALLAALPHAVERTARGLERASEVVRGIQGIEPAVEETDGPVDLNEIVARTVADLSETWRLAATVSCDYGDLPLLEHPRSDLAVVVRELIDNAIEAVVAGASPGSPKGKLRLHTRHDDGAVVLEVCDSGPGVPPEDRERVFEPWTSTRGREGQGLTVVRDVLVRQAASIEVDDAPEGGARFTVRWASA